MSKLWTPSEDAKLLKLAAIPGILHADIAVRMGRPKKGISKRLRRLPGWDDNRRKASPNIPGAIQQRPTKDRVKLGGYLIIKDCRFGISLSGGMVPA